VCSASYLSDLYLTVCLLVIYCCGLESTILVLKRSRMATRNGACRL